MKKYRSHEYAMSNSGWILLDAAEQIFKTTKDRVYNDKDGQLTLQYVHKLNRHYNVDQKIQIKNVYFQNSNQKTVQNGKPYQRFYALRYPMT